MLIGHLVEFCLFKARLCVLVMRDLEMLQLSSSFCLPFVLPQFIILKN